MCSLLDKLVPPTAKLLGCNLWQEASQLCGSNKTPKGKGVYRPHAKMRQLPAMLILIARSVAGCCQTQCSLCFDELKLVVLYGVFGANMSL